MFSTFLALPPAVVVHGLAQALAALAPGWPVTLLSAPAAAVWAGVGWWQALVQGAAAAQPSTSLHDILDCGASPGRAMAALRLGQRIIILDPACPAFARVVSLGAIVLTQRPPALDLAARGAERQLAAWLNTRV